MCLSIRIRRTKDKSKRAQVKSLILALTNPEIKQNLIFVFPLLFSVLGILTLPGPEATYSHARFSKGDQLQTHGMADSYIKGELPSQPRKLQIISLVFVSCLFFLTLLSSYRYSITKRISDISADNAVACTGLLAMMISMATNVLSGYWKEKMRKKENSKLDHYSNADRNEEDKKEEKKLSEDEMYNKLNVPFTTKEMGGKTKRYTWEQGDDEVELSIPIEESLSAKDISVAFSPETLSVKVNSVPIIRKDETLYAAVDHDECYWHIESKEDEIIEDASGGFDASASDGLGGKKFLVITLRKKEKTQRSGHWKTVVIGDEEIDTKKFGPQLVVNDDRQ